MTTLSNLKHFMTQRKYGMRAASLKACSIAMLAIACGSPETATQNSKLDIYGGSKVEKGEWRSTVAITNNGTMFCSGTVVHPRLVITAAHCVRTIGNARSLGVYVGLGREGGQVQQITAVEKFAYSPRYSQGFNGWNDIAYLKLAEDINVLEENIPQILTKPEEMEEILQVGKTVRLVGYGVRDDRGFGLKYEVDAPITSFNSNEVKIGRNGRDSCQGDSGGPAYGQLEDGSWRVFGVVSRGGRCGTGGIWGRMSANICWVQSSSEVDLALPEGTCEEPEASL